MIDLFKGKLCCHSCHHLINLEGGAKEHCPYCGKKLTRDERDYWRDEEQARELRKRNFESNLEKKELPEPHAIYRDWLARQKAAGLHPTAEEAYRVKSVYETIYRSPTDRVEIRPLPSLPLQKVHELYTKVAEAEARFSVEVSREVPEGEIWFLNKAILKQMNEDIFKDEYSLDFSPKEEKEEEDKPKYHFFFDGRWDGKEKGE